MLDLGGGMFTHFAGLPHLSALATRAAPDVVRRVVAEVDRLLARREGLFADEQIDGIEDYRQRRARGDDGDGYGDIFVLVDGWGALRSGFEDLETDLQDWATRGSSFGMHLVATTTRWSDFRPATRDLFGHRLELRLGDPLDSEIDRARAARVPERSPGRGLPAAPWRSWWLSRGSTETRTRSPSEAGIADLVSRTRGRWPGRPAPPLKLLPLDVDLDQVRRQRPPAETELLLGLAEPDLSPLALDPDADPRPARARRRRIGSRPPCCGCSAERSPALADLTAHSCCWSTRVEGCSARCPQQQLLAHQASGPGGAEAVAELAAHLTQRLPGPEVCADQLVSAAGGPAPRSSWSSTTTSSSPSRCPR